MAQIKLNATYGLTGALPAVSGASLTGISGGKILQVQSATFTDTTANGTGSFAATFLTDQITPAASSSKIFVSINVCIKAYVSSAGITKGNWTVYRQINGGGYSNCYPTQESDSSWEMRMYTGGVRVMWQTIQFVDSPSTTNAVDYKVYSYLTTGGNFAIGYESSEKKDSTIVLMEIDGS